MSEIKIVRDRIEKTEISRLASESFLDYVKAVVDTKRENIAIGGSMHADAEGVLLNDGSAQEDLWGINILPEKPREQWIEFNSLINIRPRQNNRNMEILDDGIRQKIREIVDKLIQE